MQYYKGAYYLIKLRTVDFGWKKGTKIHTCSSCINDFYFDSWSLSWTVDGKGDLSEKKDIFGMTDIQISNIQKWADSKFNDKKIGWINTFSDYETLIEYKNQFFANDNDYLIMSISFPESESEDLLAEFEPKDKENGSIGLWDNLNRRILDNNDESDQLIGYDLIGLESGGDFHTFHCHDIADDLISKFEIIINQHGLIDSEDQWKELTEYMNDVDNGFEPVPWYFARIKIINDDIKASV